MSGRRHSTTIAIGIVVAATTMCCKGASSKGDPPPLPSATGPASVPPSASSGAAVPRVPSSASAAAPPGLRLPALGFEVTATYPQKRFTWRQIEQLTWQAGSEGLPKVAPAVPLESRGCPDGMLLVDGGFLIDTAGRDDTDAVFLAQNEACSRWLTEDRGLNGLCDRFDVAKWQSVRTRFPRKPMRICIDRWEFPNAHGEFPLVVARFAESEAYCERVGKRLCTESEWTFACEGEDGLPFPTGWEADATACRIGILAAGAPDYTFKPRTLERTSRGIDIAWHGKRSGESPRCRSPFGVEDMIGNVDEWTRSVRKYGYRMILKGGHWGPGRHRCRPQTRGHGPMYVRYDAGFRCCRDAP